MLANRLVLALSGEHGIIPSLMPSRRRGRGKRKRRRWRIRRRNWKKKGEGGRGG